MSQVKPLTPVLARDQNLPLDLTRGSELPEDHDPLANGILMQHQVDWLQDKSMLKIAEKGRRTGLTYAEALDDTLIAAAARSAGGDNVFYIGDTKDKGREFIGYVAHFARIVAKQMVEIEEFIFKDKREDGSSRDISAYRVTFASGFRVEALSSRPENIRGLQGVVIIDEAAFHEDVRAVIDAVNALLIWGGRIRVISTHNGILNPFNELIREARAGKNPFKVHFIPFQKAVENGLYRRVCLIKGMEWSLKGEKEWEERIRGAYGTRTAQMNQELDAIPADSAGSALTRIQIETCSDKTIKVIRWQCSDAFKNANEHLRKNEALSFCEHILKPELDQLDKRLRHVFGEDFARSGDVTAIVPITIMADLTRRMPFIVELRNVPFDQQREILYYIVDRLPRLCGGALDARGNGQYLAEKAAQKYGSNIVEVQLSQKWYQANMPPYIEAFSDQSIIIPGDDDVIRDHQALQFVNGIIKVPDEHRTKGADGAYRHGDTAIAGALAYFASREDLPEYDYISASQNNDQLTTPLFYEQSSSQTLLSKVRGSL